MSPLNGASSFVRKFCFGDRKRHHVEVESVQSVSMNLKSPRTSFESEWSSQNPSTRIRRLGIAAEFNVSENGRTAGSQDSHQPADFLPHSQPEPKCIPDSVGIEIEETISSSTETNATASSNLSSLDSSMYCYTWPCAAVMAQYLWYHRNAIAGRTVLEVSAGTGLPAVMAAKLGCRVITSECDLEPWSDSVKALDCCKRNCERNAVTVQMIHLNWGQINASVLGLPSLDYVLLSDVLFFDKDFDRIFMMMRFLLHRFKCSCYCTYQMRDEDWNLRLKLLCRRFALRMTIVPLNSFAADRCDIGDSGLPGILYSDVYLFRFELL